jgi:Domain of unknown function (DUF4352)
MYSYLSFAITDRSLKEKRMQQPPPGQGWPQQFQQQGYGQPTISYEQPPSPYPTQPGQWIQQPYTPYPPQQGQWQQPYTPNPQWSQQPYGQPPPQPPERKKSKLPIIIGVIVALVLFAYVGAGVLASHVSSPNASTTTNSSSSNSNTTADTTSTTVPANKHYNQTDAVQVGNIYDIKILSVKTSTGSQIFQPKAGNAFLVFVIKVKNISSQEQAVSSLLNFTLQDTNGQKYNETIYPDAGATLDGKVEPGTQLQGSIVYEVPSSVKSFTLAFQASILDAGHVIWNINV